MTTCSRNGNRWSVNELLQLQREYELLDMNISEIALRHQRSEKAILFKLVAEGFVDETIMSDNSVVSNASPVIHPETTIDSQDVRLYRLECAVEAITHVVEDMRKTLVSSQKKSKLYI